MSSLTNLWDLPYPDGTDDVRDGDDVIQALAERVDYLMGESGVWSSPSAVGSSNTTVVLSRAYPNGFRVMLGPESGGTASSVNYLWWTTSRTGTGGPGGVGQFQLNVNMDVAAIRTCAWRVVPIP